MDVSIIFVNYKSKDLTINAIKSVTEKTKGLEYEIFVVDNNSQDGSIEAIEKEFPSINIIKNPINAGFGAANNIAMRQARGKYILCLNTDTLLQNNAIKIMFGFMEDENNQNVGACGAYLTNGENEQVNCGGLFPSIMGILWKFGFRYIFKDYYEKKYQGKIGYENKNLIPELGYISGADLFVRKKVLDEVGLFDENLFMFFEDTDLCKRIKDAGYKLALIENVQIQHLEGKSTKNLLQKKKWFKESEIYYFNKHHADRLWLVKFLYIIIYLIDWLILGHKDSKELMKVVINA